MSLRRIGEEPRCCRHPEHDPPGHIVLEPGLYEHECPACGRKVRFRVRCAELSTGDVRSVGRIPLGQWPERDARVMDAWRSGGL